MNARATRADLIPAARAAELAAEIVRRLRGVSGRLRAVAVGSVRRGTGAPTKDIDILVIDPDPGVLAGAVLAPRRRGDRLEIVRVRAAGLRRRAVTMEARGARGARRVQVDLFHATPAEAPYALFHYTGSRAYTIRVRAHAKRRGWRLNQYGLFEAGHPTRKAPGTGAIRTEGGLARFLGVTERPPADRER